MRPLKTLLAVGLLFAPLASRAQVQNVPTPNNTYTGPAVPTICVSTAGVLSSCAPVDANGNGKVALYSGASSCWYMK